VDDRPSALTHESNSSQVDLLAKKKKVSMRSLIHDMRNGRELIDELDLATAAMMSIPVELIGGAQWREAACRQHQAFKDWREYLHHMADGRMPVEALQVA
jgi:hypothetical protein